VGLAAFYYSFSGPDQVRRVLPGIGCHRIMQTLTHSSVLLKDGLINSSFVIPAQAGIQ
jgi:hypothetical protein